MGAAAFHLVGPAYTAQSPVVDCEQLVNFFVEAVESPTGQVQYALLPCPGLTPFATAPQSPIRGLFSQDGRCFLVAGGQLLELGITGGLTLHGVVVIDGHPATFASNGQAGHQLAICSGGAINILDLVSGVYTANVVVGARMVAFLDGYFLRLDPVTSTLGFSNLLNGLVWDPLDVVQRNTGGDKWLAMVVARKRIWLTGSASTDVYWNSGDALNPLQPVDGAFFQTGIDPDAPFSLCVMGEGEQESVQWIAVSDKGPAGIVRATEGGRQHLSTPAVDYGLSQYPSRAAVGWTYQMDGHSFYVLNFPAPADQTWVNDSVLPLGLGWHQRGQWDSPISSYHAYRPQCHTYCFGQHLVGDRASGTIFVLDTSHATEVDGTGIRRVRQAPVYLGTEDWVPRHELEIAGHMGQGLSVGQGSDPQLLLSWSNDRGGAFGNEHARSFGKIGERTARAVWSRLGRARGNSRVYRAVMSDPVPWRLHAGTETT